MIAAIKSKLTNSVSHEIASAFHSLNQFAAPGILNQCNSEIANVMLLFVLILIVVCVVENVARVNAFGKITSTTTFYENN